MPKPVLGAATAVPKIERPMVQQRIERRAIDGIVLLDKPAGLSSNAALQKVRSLFRAEKAGHTGSLDPMATGLLPICLGQATKLCGLLLDSSKSYRARARLGVRTDSGDADGKEIGRCTAEVERAVLEALIPRFSGPILQVPPMVSALKQGGRRLYEMAREGVEVDRAPRSVEIHELRLIALEDGEFEFEVRCSKGTYIRTLAQDWAEAAGTCAHLVALRRTAVQPFDSLAMLDLDAVSEQIGTSGSFAPACLLPLSAAVVGWTQWTADAEEELRLGRGQAIPSPSGLAQGRVAVLGRSGMLIGLAENDATGSFRPRRWLSETNAGSILS